MGTGTGTRRSPHKGPVTVCANSENKRRTQEVSSGTFRGGIVFLMPERNVPKDTSPMVEKSKAEHEPCMVCVAGWFSKERSAIIHGGCRGVISLRHKKDCACVKRPLDTLALVQAGR